MKKVLFASLLLVASGCSISSSYVQTNARTYSPTNAADIKVYSSAAIDGDYQVIGSVVSFSQGDGVKAVNKLRSEAAELGADAIIALQLDKINSVAQSTGASGVAVKFQ